jgi:hypothetical protein
MKKFGTPIGAGPGSESEKVGLVADGTPLPVGSLFAAGAVVLGLGLGLGLDFDFDFDLGFWPEPGLIGLGPPLCVDVGWILPGPEGCGGVSVAPVEVVLVVEVVLELVPALVELLLVDVVLVVDVVELEEVGAELVVDGLVVDELVVDGLVVDEPVVVAGPQLIVSETTTPWIGSDSDETGVPAGTSTGKVNCCPPSRITVTVHALAEASGIAASPRMITADVTAAISFRLPNTVACLLLPSRVRMEWCRDHMAA